MLGSVVHSPDAPAHATVPEPESDPSTNGAYNAVVAKNGPGASTAPHSSRNRHRSTNGPSANATHS